MTDHPLVSVVLPTYNRATSLPRAVASVLSQTYRNLELIIVDDASNDNTAELVGAYERERVRYLRLEHNVGAAAARNRGIAMASGPLIAFQDSDDMWLPEKLQRDVEVLAERTDVGVSVCSFTVTTGGKHYRIRHAREVIDGETCAQRLLMGTAMPTQTLVVRKEALLAIGGFDEALPRRQDIDLCLRLARGCRFSLGDDYLVDNYVSEDSISNDPARYVAATDRLLDTHRELFARYPRGHAFQMYNVAKHLAFTGHRDEALPYARRAVALDGSNRKARILLLGLRTGTVRLLKAFSR